jgi:small subunit ribosomal protein S13
MNEQQDQKKQQKRDAQKAQAPPQPQAVRPQQQSNVRYLVRVVNTDLEGRKQLVIALQKIKGISHVYAAAICTVAGVSKTKKTGELSEAEVHALEEVILNPGKHHFPAWLLNRRKDPETGNDKHLITSDLSFTNDLDIKLMKKTKSYKGLRHQWGLPVRGQRTKSNFRRNKGKGLGVKKKSAPGKK